MAVYMLKWNTHMIVTCGYIFDEIKIAIID